MTTVSPDQSRKLRTANVVMGALHAAQGVAVLALANDFALPVTATYLQGQPGVDTARETVTLFDLPTGAGVATFLFLSAAAHWLIATVLFPRYIEKLGDGQNPYRWIEYSLSASLMIVLIAQLTGISEATTLLALAGVNASMIFFGWLVEHYETPGKPNWIAFNFGCIAGIVPWAAITLMVVSPGSSAEPPAFVYGIFVSLFLFFNTFALNQWLQYRGRGRWADYLHGERVYIGLSLAAKSALAWQVFGGTLAG